MLLAGCGKEGAPLPPEPRGPFPASAVRIRQVGPSIEVGFTVPQLRPGAGARIASAELLRVAFPPGPAPPADAGAFTRRGEVVAASDVALEQGTRILLTDGSVPSLDAHGVGWLLRYAVRLRDERKRPSPLAAAEDLVVVEPPGPPSAFAGAPDPEGIRLTWQAAPGEGPLRYAVYRAEGEGTPSEDPVVPPIEQTIYVDESVHLGTAYTYWVRTYLPSDTPGPPHESASAGPVRVTAIDIFPPAPPQGVVAVQEGPAVRLFWQPGPERDLAGYHVYRRDPGGDWSRLTDTPANEPLWLDRDVRPGDVRAYRVTAIDSAPTPNESAPSDIVEIAVVEEPPPSPETPPAAGGDHP